jgi:hypothetical protein
VTWVKEGRKYDLGALLITQQPGSIPSEILSQGDNWFVFHLLSASDLAGVERANAHFSEDLLSVLLNEPIPGHCIYWSSVSGTPYPISIRAFSFETMFTMHDPSYAKPAARTYAAKLKARYLATLSPAAAPDASRTNGRPAPSTASVPVEGEGGPDQTADHRPAADGPDAKAILEARAIDGLRSDAETMARLQNDAGMPWGLVTAALEKHLPDTVDQRQEFAFRLVPRALTELFGPEGQGWQTFRAERNGRATTHVRAIPSSREG